MIDRKKELSKLLNTLRQVDTNDNSDIDLILEYLEYCIAEPKLSGGSKKLQEFQIENDPVTLTKVYHITWKQPINLSI